MTLQERQNYIVLCRSQLMTCTNGQPGDEDATYAIAWLPLDNAHNFSDEVRAKHKANYGCYNSNSRSEK